MKIATKSNWTGWRRIVGLLLANFLGAVLAPPLLARMVLKSDEQFTAAQSFGIGALTFIALVLIEIAVSLEALRRDHEEIERFVFMRNQMEIDLNAIRSACESAGAGSNGSLLRRYFGRAVGELRSTLESGAASREIVVDKSFLFLSDLVLDEFRGMPTDVVSVVHKFGNNEAIMRAHELEWLRKVDECARRKRIRQVRRLFVVADDREMDDEVSRALVACHAKDARYDYRVLREKHYVELMSDYRAEVTMEDFGIYGTYTCFRGMAYSDGCEGVYSVRENDIEELQQAFDACWTSSLAVRKEVDALPGEHLPRSMQDFLRQAAGT